MCKKILFRYTNNGDKMKYNTRNIIIITLSILLVVIYIAASTYAVIINVVQNDGLTEIISEIKVRDLLTDDNGEYNEYYYNIKRETDLTDTEANILINSDAINERLQDVLNSIVNYKVNNGQKYTNDELYNIIVDAVNRTEGISSDVKTRIINKSSKYINDISKYIYDIEVNITNNG